MSKNSFESLGDSVDGCANVGCGVVVVVVGVFLATVHAPWLTRIPWRAAVFCTEHLLKPISALLLAIVVIDLICVVYKRMVGSR